jgi:hypothetical protein
MSLIDLPAMDRLVARLRTRRTQAKKSPGIALTSRHEQNGHVPYTFATTTESCAEAQRRMDAIPRSLVRRPPPDRFP